MMQVIVGTSPKLSSEKVLSAPEDFDWENVSQEELLAMAGTPSLLGDKKAFRFSGSLTGERAEEFFDSVSEFVRSSHQFIFL